MGPIAEGYIVTAPDADGHVDILIPSFDDEQKFEGCSFMPRPDGDPAPDQRCCVAFPPTGAPWVIAYEP